MSDLRPCVRARTLILAVALAIGLASATLPAARPAEAQALPDLTIPIAPADFTVHRGERIQLIYVIKNLGPGSVTRSTAWNFPVPFGFKIAFFQQAGGLWQCLDGPTSKFCYTDLVLAPGFQASFRVELVPRDPIAPPVGTFRFESVIDATRNVAESNEGNNSRVTTVTIVP
jgi:hypothetical protein